MCVRGRNAGKKEDTKKNAGSSTPLKYLAACIFSSTFATYFYL
jgi:hypothetical protein